MNSDERRTSRGSLHAGDREQIDGGAGNRPTLQSARGWRRFALMTLALLFFVLAVLGAFLPGLPATPFLLLTSYFLVRSSPELNDRLLRSRFFGPILVDWQQHGGVQAHIKVKAIVFVVLAVTLTIYFARLPLAASYGVGLSACVGIWVILRLPKPDSKNRNA